MKCYRGLEWPVALTALLLLSCGGIAQAEDSAAKGFPSYHAAVAALVAAEAANDEGARKDILGAQAADLISSGDAVADDKARVDFVKHYHEAHAFIRESPDRVILTVGASAWPLPFPIVRASGGWHFDAVAGAQELTYRRIGRNELDAIRVCNALKQAQIDYASAPHDGNPPGLYAQRIHSKAGTQNGLYWEVNNDDVPSPAGSLIAEAAGEGYDTAPQIGKRTPFHGYFYRILKSQGAHATGGAREYVQDGKMDGGFAILAYPAEYGGSGVMTLMIAKHGSIYQKDLGQDTEGVAKSMTAFDPDDSWKKAN